MNPRQWWPLLRRATLWPRSECEILRVTHDLQRRRLWIPANSDPSLNNRAQITAKFVPARKDRSGPERRQINGPTASNVGPPLPQTIFSGSGVRGTQLGLDPVDQSP